MYILCSCLRKLCKNIPLIVVEEQIGVYYLVRLSSTSTYSVCDKSRLKWATRIYSRMPKSTLPGSRGPSPWCSPRPWGPGLQLSPGTDHLRSPPHRNRDPCVSVALHSAVSHWMHRTWGGGTSLSPRGARSEASARSTQALPYLKTSLTGLVMVLQGWYLVVATH